MLIYIASNERTYLTHRQGSAIVHVAYVYPTQTDKEVSRQL